MKRFLPLLSLPFFAATSWAASTINPSEPYSYGANIGWMNWRPSAADGVEVDEYVLSGWIWGANVGWINMGDGTPENNVQYSNASATDFGVNYVTDPTQPGRALLRGFAYGANIGWINFESVGNPRLRFSDGRMEGFAWSANCGWINLGDGTFAVKTDFILPGLDTDTDGLADAYEFLYLGGLAGDPNADNDGDMMTNLQEYLEGTAANNANDRLRITMYTANPGGTNNLITWASTVSRLYQIEVNSNQNLDPAQWMNDVTLGVITPDAGTSTTRNVVSAASFKRFYRVRAIRPLAP